MWFAKLRKRLFIAICWLLLSFVLLSVLIVLPFRWVNPPMSMVMVERWLSAENADYQHDQDWLAWDAIPPELALAVMTAEDQRFPLHHGFDTEAIYDAVLNSLNGKPLRGASTISQQVAKNMFLWTGRSWLRKGLEVWFTLLIEICWPKQRILEIYLNIAEWGKGVFGAQAAARHHFGQALSQLNSQQYALLAVSLPSPLKYKPAAPTHYLVDRAKWNREQQKRLGGISWLKQIAD